MTTGASDAIDARADDALVGEIAERAGRVLRKSIPELEIEPQPGYATVEVLDHANRLTFVVGLHAPASSDRRLAVWVLPARGRPFATRRGLRQVSVATLDDAIAAADAVARWVADAITAVRAASLEAIEAARARREADSKLLDGSRREAEARERARIQARADAQTAARLRTEQMEREAAVRREAEEAARRHQREAALAAVRDGCASDFLGVQADSDLLSQAEVDGVKADFVAQWAVRHLADPLDPEQAAAVAATGGDVKVVARAGSGKTRTLTARATFLQKHCGVAPSEVLLLAFNRKAADEMRMRIASAVGDDLPHVMTFHALAYALVHPQEPLLYDDVEADQLRYSREVQEVIDEHIRSPEFHDRIRDLMLAHFRDDWERIARRGVDLSIDEFLARRRALPRETLGGQYVKSFGEREIANALFEHDIPYEYEQNRRWNGINYRPDFTVPRPGGGIAIEYFGLTGEADYDLMSEAKRTYWAGQTGWTLVEFGPDDLAEAGPDAFRQAVVARLAALGVPIRRRPEEEIWQIVRRRAVDRFTKAMKAFVVRARQRNLEPSALVQLVASHTSLTESEGLFLNIGCSIYDAYLARLKRLRREDFDGLLWRATAMVNGGATRFARQRGTEQGDLGRLRFILIDEFQDFSEMFFELTMAIRRANPNASLFCVGDDWQAINGFAGADLAYFTGFGERFRDPQERAISTNYRSTAAVVKAGNAVMLGRGQPAAIRPDAEAGRVRVALLDGFDPSTFERERHQADEATPAVLRLVRDALDRGSKVALLCRRNWVPWYVRYRNPPKDRVNGLKSFLDHVRAFLPEEDGERVTISTVNSYKGLEEEVVIVLDALEGSYPLVHPNWSFNRVFGERVDRLIDEERRLFYVAVTRAKQSLILLTERQRKSPFLLDLEAVERLPVIQWSELPEVGNLTDARVEIQVYDSFPVKDQLKRLGYSYASNGRYWHRTFQEAGLDVAAILTQPWADRCGEIVARTATGELIRLREPGALAAWVARNAKPSS